MKKMIIALGLFFCMTVAAHASGVTVSRIDDKYVKMGGRIQFQYHRKTPNSGQSSDDLFFRRFRPYIEGSIHNNWKGKFQWDMGKSSGDNELAVKDAYMQYKGIENLKITIGNANFPFSREKLTSSKKQQLVERTFVGDHNYGTPDRQLGIHFEGRSDDKTITWGAAMVQAAIDPDDDKLDFDTLANKNSDFNEGWMAGGRVDFHPLGYLKMSQGDFKRKSRATIGVAAFSWSNDDDNNTRTINGSAVDSTKPDVDSVTGFEISGAFRAAGFSVDIEYNKFQTKTIDSTVTSGIFKNGEADLQNLAVEGGYMIVPAKIEVVAGYQSQDADNYGKKWNRTSVGINYFFEKHDIKTQITYRRGENLKGQDGNNENELFAQMQYVF